MRSSLLFGFCSSGDLNVKFLEPVFAANNLQYVSERQFPHRTFPCIPEETVKRSGTNIQLMSLW